MTEKNRNRHICTGLMAHVDSGKTTLSEALLYTSGAIRKLGKVDTKDAFLDTDERERARGITIFSKQAELTWEGTKLTLLDTPGHVDFSAEMERVLQVLDYAVLLISGADGVQGHTQTLWSLLQQYEIPTFLFINKMDQPGADREALMAELKSRLSEGCIDFTHAQRMAAGGTAQDTTKKRIDADESDPQRKDTEAVELWYEELATCQEEALETYLETGSIPKEQIQDMIADRLVFPCYFGSALKMQGIEEFLNGFVDWTEPVQYPVEFSAKVYKISRDEQGNRLTHLKVTGGILKVKDLLCTKTEGEDETLEKVNQIRIYSGEKYEVRQEVQAGEVCAVTGLQETYPGQGLGEEAETLPPILEPVLTCQVCLPEGCDPAVMLPKLKQLEEEQPELHIIWDEQLQEIQAQIMGEIQTEILQSVIAERFGVDVTFGSSHIVYKETIANTVEGVGHFEPLRHYAEVHLLMEPLPAGSGLVFAADCSEDLLDKNWQRLILTHLMEREHRGVLTGSAITDMKLTLIAGRAHQKHTEGGDFRQATYRAIRQGLMEAESVLLEPYYQFRMEIPEEMIGRAMMDVEKMSGTFELAPKEHGLSVLTGIAPVSEMQSYPKEVAAYTKGFGRIFLTPDGYAPCHNTEEVIAAIGYDAEHDLANPSGSVFCAHGAGFNVPWNEVKEHMHVEGWQPETAVREELPERATRSVMDEWIGVDEVDAILEKTFYANSGARTRRNGVVRRRRVESRSESVTRSFAPQPKQQEYLLVDGYNIIFAWEELKELARENMDAARGILLDKLCNYQGMKQMEVIAVFDAYRVAGHQTECSDYHNIHVVFTKEAETADQYIEKFAHTNAAKYQVTVATSDGLEQVIIRGEGCRLLSAQDLHAEMELSGKQLRESYLEQPMAKNRLIGELLEAQKKAEE
ncbi:MAG: TetM/TetW/TetO/TetS family tetracycline resistance ribosomal protection protein [Lachnospiraceae bacterium]|nr:TetM/TetW/TetO/TetS family tetracycline resistance ribosomal protection protein [Lachnospiraceae bacterium]